MEKETSISKQLEQLLQEEDNDSSRLQVLSSWISKHHKLKNAFCEIHGNRWSHISGDTDLLYAEERIILSPVLGLLLQSQDGKHSLPDETIRALRKCCKYLIREENRGE
ncbi:hypothetical protein GF407_02395 [candidate division KSB1 bacterium]|nr:hypothetical protein [candidate division KSB1 bacterium]